MKTQSFASLKASAPFFCLFVFLRMANLLQQLNWKTQTHKTTDVLEYKRNKKEKVTHQI